MSSQKELTDLESGPASIAGVVTIDGPASSAASHGSQASSASRPTDHVLDFNISNFSTPKGKQILHDVGAYPAWMPGSLGRSIDRLIDWLLGGPACPKVAAGSWRPPCRPARLHAHTHTHTPTSPCLN
jgi:hypothetical protein